MSRRAASDASKLKLTSLLEETEYDTLDEAIAAAMAEVEPGGTVSVHAEDCESDDGEDGCTCEPLILTVGAKA